MRLKTLIALLLSLVMLFTLAAPALAAKPIKTELYQWVSGGPTGPISGEVSFQTTHDNHLKITVVVEGAQAGTTYKAMSNWGLQFDSNEFTVGKNGKGRFMAVTGRQWDDGTIPVPIAIHVTEGLVVKYATLPTNIEF